MLGLFAITKRLYPLIQFIIKKPLTFLSRKIARKKRVGFYTDLFKGAKYKISAIRLLYIITVTHIKQKIPMKIHQDFNLGGQ